jgi:hypothetical protein
MPNMRKSKIFADKIAEKASRGEDVSMHFTNEFTAVKTPSQSEFGSHPRSVEAAATSGPPGSTLAATRL